MHPLQPRAGVFCADSSLCHAKCLYTIRNIGISVIRRYGMSRKLLGSVLILSMLFLALPVYGQGGEGAVCFSETDLDFLEDNGYAFSGDVAQVAFVETIAGIAGEVAYPEEIDAEGFS